MLIIETITFYSYKGGVGRTLALANIAIYLSRFGQKVCILDFDLEAPGLHYKFPQLVKTTDIKKGLVDYIYEFTTNGTIPPSLNEFTLNLSTSLKSQKEIQLVPAGNFLSSDYWRKLASIDWHRLFYEESGEGIPFFIELKERIEKELDPDFLLIDSRTGVTEMSGLCTSLLPDKVVFLIVNNRENIEGARQILQSIQKVQRLPGQKPIDVTFALSRIPFPTEETDKGKEKQIINNIKNFLNEPIKDLENQLNIQNICILHSDRELELSESLRINREGLQKEAPLLRDYLRLFSNIIPETVILPKLQNIIDEITNTGNLFENPDKIQEELEGLVVSYPHQKTLKKLIEFYILRNVGREKILNTFHELWNTFGIDNNTVLSKYVSIFMKDDNDYWRTPKVELAIIENYIKQDPKDKIPIEKKLAKSYRVFNAYDMALKHYLGLLDKVAEKNEILKEILEIYILKNNYNDAEKLLKKYSDLIDSDTSLRVLKVEIMFNIGNIDEIRKLLEDEGVTERALSLKMPNLYVDVMNSLGKSEELNRKMIVLLNDAMTTNSRSSPGILVGLGVGFHKMGRFEEFKNRVRDHPDAKEIIRFAERESNEKNKKFRIGRP